MNESRFQSREGQQKPDHDLPATAETRARNRSYANLFGHGEVSAEEISAATEAKTPDETKENNHQRLVDSTFASFLELVKLSGESKELVAKAAYNQTGAPKVSWAKQSDTDLEKLNDWFVSAIAARSTPAEAQVVESEEL